MVAVKRGTWDRTCIQCCTVTGLVFVVIIKKKMKETNSANKVGVPLVTMSKLKLGGGDDKGNSANNQVSKSNMKNNNIF